jgi:hypothetical protein
VALRWLAPSDSRCEALGIEDSYSDSWGIAAMVSGCRGGGRWGIWQGCWVGGRRCAYDVSLARPQSCLITRWCRRALGMGGAAGREGLRRQSTLDRSSSWEEREAGADTREGCLIWASQTGRVASGWVLPT